MLTFSQFMDIVENAQDAAGVQAQIAQLDAKLAQVTAPLLAQKNQLVKKLATMQNQQQQQQQAPQMGAAPNTTTTPGSTGAATPGASNPLA